MTDVNYDNYRVLIFDPDEEHFELEEAPPGLLEVVTGAAHRRPVPRRVRRDWTRNRRRDGLRAGPPHSGGDWVKQFDGHKPRRCSARRDFHAEHTSERVRVLAVKAARRTPPILMGEEEVEDSCVVDEVCVGDGAYTIANLKAESGLEDEEATT